MKTVVASSIPEAIQAAIELLDGWGTDDPPYYWFRGIKDVRLRLRPGAYWRTNYEEIGPLLSLTQEGVAFTKVGSIDEWETYCLAQHHGIPTRLLDWTESFSAALFFAFDGWDGKTTPCIWILQPYPFNEVFIKWPGVIAPENSTCAKIWLPKNVAKNDHIVQQHDGYVYDNDWPIAIYARQTNSRIHAQQGSFTVHGRDDRPLEEIVSSNGGDPDSIFARIDLKGFDKESVLKDLTLLGIRRSAIYPDIDNFVKQIKEYYNW